MLTDKKGNTMEFKSDIEIAQSIELQPVMTIAHKAQIAEEYVIPYGSTKAKISLDFLSDMQAQAGQTGESGQPEQADQRQGKLILVTAITPTPAGEGKTTTSVGLADGLNKIGKHAILALREPSLGPVFGVKGGAAGGGYAQVVPMEEINLHFTGDFHAIGAANNLLAALLDNHIQQGNELGIDPKTITWKRAVDMNDRQLRHIVDGLGGPKQGVPREDGFDITVASEVMAILCLATDLADLKARLARIVVASTYEGKPVTAADLKAQGAMCALLKDALAPNLVQTLEHNPAFVHGGPFANIAHGCNSVVATKLALAAGDYVVTEAGFGADLGAEKFCDIKCRLAGLSPTAVVVVATIRALKMHGGLAQDKLGAEDLAALEQGLPNLLQHVENMVEVFGMNVCVAINAFPTDTPRELELVREKCQEFGVEVALSEVWAKGGEGGVELANKVVALAEKPSTLRFAYELTDSLADKIKAVAQKVYRATDIELSPAAAAELARIEELGFGNLPICMAKTQYSFSDDPALLGAPRDFTLHITQVKLCSGAGFVVVMTGDIMTMPGLPKEPAAHHIDIDENGVITGLF